MHVYLIAEIACEHLGSVARAKQLIDDAVAAKVDAVKFQCYRQGEVGRKVWKWIKQHWLTLNQLDELKEYAEKQGVNWLCSAFGIDSLRILESIGLRTIKIPSPKLTDLKMLDVAGELFPGIILSTGLHNLNEVQKATTYLNLWLEPKSVAVLHCTSAYPCPYNKVNLKAMLTLREQVSKAGKFGISDHSFGNVVPVAAAALGADIIEKHITLSRANGGPDACCSLEPLELVAMVRAVRDTEAALGNGEKVIEDVEKSLLCRKSK